MAEDKIFPKGMFADEKSGNYGSFTKLSFKVEEFIAFLNEHKNDAGYVNINIFKSTKTGKPYPVLDTYKKPETVLNSDLPKNTEPTADDSSDLPPF